MRKGLQGLKKYEITSSHLGQNPQPKTKQSCNLKAKTNSRQSGFAKWQTK